MTFWEAVNARRFSTAGIVLMLGAGSLFASACRKAASDASPVASSSGPPVAPSAPSQTAIQAKGGAMLRIPGGSFQMGETWVANAQPVHEVKVEPFEMDVTEVTVEAFRACVDSGACKAYDTANWKGITEANRRKFGAECNWGKSDRDKHPINCVDWDQATAHCKWAGKRLPTEEEWEYAARGTEGRKYPWGSTEPSAKLVNACGLECVARAKRVQSGPGKPLYDEDDGWETTARVGSYSAGATPLGLLDMVGNVEEWTASGYSENYSKVRSTSQRVIRGDSFSSAAGPSTISRFGRDTGDRVYNVGFRCVR